MPILLITMQRDRSHFFSSIQDSLSLSRTGSQKILCGSGGLGSLFLRDWLFLEKVKSIRNLGVASSIRRGCWFGRDGSRFSRTGRTSS